MLVLSDPAFRRIPERLVYRQRWNGLVISPQPLACNHKVQVEVNEQPEQQRMGAHIDLGEGVVEQDEARRIRGGARDRAEMRRGSREQRQVADDFLLTLGQRRPAMQIQPPAIQFRPGVPDPEREPLPVVERPAKVLDVGQLGLLGPGRFDQPVQAIPERLPLIGQQRLRAGVRAARLPAVNREARPRAAASAATPGRLVRW